MNLLDTILRVSNSQQYVDRFKEHEVDAFTLKLLSEEDLEIIGVEDENLRKSILQHADKFDIPAEYCVSSKIIAKDSQNQLRKQVTIVIDKQYVRLVLNQMSMQLMKHLAVLTIALKRNDIHICDVRLNPAAKCLQTCVQSLDRDLQEFEFKVLKAKKKKKQQKLVVLSALGLTTAILAMYMVCSVKKLPLFFKQ